MLKVTGSGTISEDCGFELEYLTGTPATSVSVGDRWYVGQEESGDPLLVHHTNGSPSNACSTTVYTPKEVNDAFSWEWYNVPSFKPVVHFVNLCFHNRSYDWILEEWKKMHG